MPTTMILFNQSAEKDECFLFENGRISKDFSYNVVRIYRSVFSYRNSYRIMKQ